MRLGTAMGAEASEVPSSRPAVAGVVSPLRAPVDEAMIECVYHASARRGASEFHAESAREERGRKEEREKKRKVMAYAHFSRRRRFFF